jgi:hypothetical protein
MGWGGRGWAGQRGGLARIWERHGRGGGVEEVVLLTKSFYENGR